jgi:hypothetical protein
MQLGESVERVPHFYMNLSSYPVILSKAKDPCILLAPEKPQRSFAALRMTPSHEGVAVHICAESPVIF